MNKNLKIWIWFLTIFIIILWIVIFNYFQNKSEIKEILNWSWITEEEKQDLEKELEIDSSKVNSKIDGLKKKIKLKWLIAKADMYFDENDYMIALIQYQKVLKEIPNDMEVNLKVWDIYYKINRFKKANEHYALIKDSKILNKDKAILSLINEKWVKKENLEELKTEINSFDISPEKKFYYTNSITCIVDYSLCRDGFQKYFEKNQNLETEEMKVMFNAFEAFKNFKTEDLYYKAAFVTWAFYQNSFYYVALKTSENILKQKNNYNPIMKVAAKSAYEIWDYMTAKKYLTEIKNSDPDDAEITYFLARVYEKLNDRVLALVNYKKAIIDNYKDIIDIKRRIIFLYFDSWETKKMLEAFDDLLATNDKNLNENDYSLAVYHNILNDDLEKAEHYSKIAIEKFDKTELFYGYYSWILLQDENISLWKLKLVEENLEKAMEINRKNPMILMTNWIFELKNKNYDKALVNLKSALWQDKTWEYKDTINTWIKKVTEEKNKPKEEENNSEITN